MRQLSRSSVLFAIVLAIAGCDRESAPKGAVDGGESVMSVPAMAPAPAAMRAGVVRETSADAAAEPPAALARMAASVPAFDPAAMLIRRATAGVEVDSLDRAMAAARDAAARHGGIVANAQVSTGRSELHRATLQIRVPSDRFDALLGGLAPLGRVESVAISTQDVGEEFVDLEARLVNLRRLEARIIELLANRTGKLADVLSVEHELARVRGEIEQIEGRRRYLQRSASMSTLDLTLHERDPILANTPVRSPIAVAVQDAWRNLVGAVAWGIAALGVVIPLAVVVTALVVAARWLRRRLDDDDTLGARA